MFNIEIILTIIVIVYNSTRMSLSGTSLTIKETMTDTNASRLTTLDLQDKIVDIIHACCSRKVPADVYIIDFTI